MCYYSGAKVGIFQKICNTNIPVTEASSKQEALLHADVLLFLGDYFIVGTTFYRQINVTISAT